MSYVELDAGLKIKDDIEEKLIGLAINGKCTELIGLAKEIYLASKNLGNYFDIDVFRELNIYLVSDYAVKKYISKGYKCFHNKVEFFVVVTLVTEKEAKETVNRMLPTIEFSRPEYLREVLQIVEKGELPVFRQSVVAEELIYDVMVDFYREKVKIKKPFMVEFSYGFTGEREAGSLKIVVSNGYIGFGVDDDIMTAYSEAVKAYSLATRLLASFVGYINFKLVTEEEAKTYLGESEIED